MDYTFLTGVVGGVILVAGGAWPEKPKAHPTKSVKNWLLAVGGLILLIYSILLYLTGGPIFFAFLEVLVMIASVMMMADVRDKIDTAVMTISGLGFTAWSLYLFEDYRTLVFILGIVCVGLGYTLQMGTLRRNTALTLGSAFIAIYSYIESNMVFFWLNVFFATFAGYYVIKLLRKKV